MRSILAILCIIFASQAFSKNLRDSVGVENNNGKQVILHKVAAKENFYSIGRLYNVHPKDIMEVNKIKTLQPGITLRVPTGRPFVSGVTGASRPNDLPADNFIEYKVGPKETLFAIARRFNTSVDEIRKINNLRSNSLSVGQIIKVKQGITTAQAIGEQAAAVTPDTPVIKPAETDTAAADNTRIHTNRYGLTERSERGIAVWIADQYLDSTKMLALHKTAPVGTVIKITNPMTGKSTFTKVVGKYTENETTKDVIIVITKATADLLGALDKRFQVTIDYGVPNE
ncbi:muramidase family protein [Pararcticibacter amylolyticus]|uniref:Peptidoglycan-binding protein n=1 Tax=Pararcticibacter amylolyticus TaxID=2173175 RepID=A0A2U2PK69_9SPHI|nr:LysM peptidoglycan-binding domain-containing protein [Pararcticibacter amylolyticus]PWG81790.1 peptidoglycan-binding protein [Pararcticibacter amylolyticus]